MITYQDLREWLDTLTPEQLTCNVAVIDPYENEIIPIFDIGITNDTIDTLDSGHPFLLLAD